MCAVENSPTLFAIIIGLRPKPSDQQTTHNRWISLSVSLNFSTFFRYFLRTNFKKRGNSLNHGFFLHFSMVLCFQGWLLRLSVTRYFNPLFNSFFTFDTPLLIVTYTLLVDPSNRRRRRKGSFVSADGVSASTTWNVLAEPKP